MPMDNLDRRIINHLQDGFPICSSPYRQAALQLGVSETELLERIGKLLDKGILSRFGPMYHAEQMGGALTLAALSVPPQRFEQVAEIVNAFPQVAHNYQRDHKLNMWFVIAVESPEQIQQVIDNIEQKTGLPVYNLPKVNEYYVGLKLQA